MKTERIKLRPYTLVIRTTERCNVGCYHCSISATPKGNDLPYGLAVKAIEEAKEGGLNRVHFTGGEPLLYDHLAELISITRDLGMSTDITSSTFTKTGEDTLGLIGKLKDGGLECVMLSYDDPHSRKVSLQQFTQFTRRSLDLGIHVCVFVTEGGNTSFKTADLKDAFINEGIDTDKIEWSVSRYQYEGRGEKHIGYSAQPTEVEEHYCRCPYVMAVPTLTPNGEILLCHMSRFTTKNFIVGKYPDESLSDIFYKMEHSPIYRYLSKYGPQQSLRNLDFARSEVPKDMCRACEKYLTTLELKEYQDKLDTLLIDDDLSEIDVDIKAILPIYQRYLMEHGEKYV